MLSIMAARVSLSGTEAFAPPPFSPVGFSAEMERVSALESNGRLPRFKLNILIDDLLWSDA
jgi:hypothetical protein